MGTLVMIYVNLFCGGCDSPLIICLTTHYYCVLLHVCGVVIVLYTKRVVIAAEFKWSELQALQGRKFMRSTISKFDNEEVFVYFDIVKLNKFDGYLMIPQIVNDTGKQEFTLFGYSPQQDICKSIYVTDQETLDCTICTDIFEGLVKNNVLRLVVAFYFGCK